MKNFFSTSLAFLFSWASSFAQLNESDTLKYQLRCSATGNYQQGNVEVLNLKSKIDFSFAPNHNFVFKSQNSSLYQTFFKVKADNDIFSRNYIYYKPTKIIYPFAIAYISSNYRRKINERYFAGAGLTFQAINTKLHVLKFSISSVYEVTSFAKTTFNFAEYNGNDNIRLWRGTLYMSGWNYLAGKKIRLYYDAYWQPAYSNKNNYRTQVDLALDFPIYKGLSFNVLFALFHENVVINKVKQDDKLLTFGFAYNFRSI